jgi:alpha-glucosidase
MNSKPKPTRWYERSVLYQVYPLSFSDSNADGFGDLKGVIEHLDYLNDGTPESLGVGAIWLSPIFKSPMADWGYDITNYTQVDPIFGTIADLDLLVFEAHKRGIKVLLDLVVNHTSVEHGWFKDSRSSLDSEKRDWYIWANPDSDGLEPNNWLSRFGGSAWTYDDQTKQYYLHTFLADQPDLNWRNPKVKEAIGKMMNFWLNRGIDGFRADAVTALIKDPTLQDDDPNPNYRVGIDDPAEANIRNHSEVKDEYVDIITTFCSIMSSKEDSFLISEAYLDIPGLQELYRACDEHPIHSPFNFNLIGLDWSAKGYRSFIDEYEDSMRPEDLPNYVLGNHDRSRIVTRLGYGRARLLAMMQMTLRGLPVIYYGEELGLVDIDISKSQRRDLCNNTINGSGRDGVRTPMPWTVDDASSTTSTKWLPEGINSAQLSVESQAMDPQSMLNFYRHLIHLRKSLLAFSQGSYRSIETRDSDVYGYVREDGMQRCYVYLNFSSQPSILGVGKIGRWIGGTHLVDGDGEFLDIPELTLQPYEGRIYELRRGE